MDLTIIVLALKLKENESHLASFQPKNFANQSRVFSLEKENLKGNL